MDYIINLNLKIRLEVVGIDSSNYQSWSVYWFQFPHRLVSAPCDLLYSKWIQSHWIRIGILKRSLNLTSYCLNITVKRDPKIPKNEIADESVVSNNLLFVRTPPSKRAFSRHLALASRLQISLKFGLYLHPTLINWSWELFEILLVTSPQSLVSAPFYLLKILRADIPYKL